MKTFKEFQEMAAYTAIYPGRKTIMGLTYVGLGLGESGEVQGKIKKVLRDDNGEITPEKRQAILDEAGDVLWYLAMLCEELDEDLESIALANIRKLFDRKKRDVLRGSGDTR